MTGITLGTMLVTLDGLKPVHVLFLAGTRLSISTALIALSANLAVTWLVIFGRKLMMVEQR